MSQLFELKDQVIIVTGGAGLLGQPYAHALAAAGARVVVSDVNEAKAIAVAEAVQAEGGEALAVKTDVTSKESIQALVQATLAKWGRIDGLLNNAALDPKFDAAGSGQHSATFEDYPLEMWNASLAVNVTGMFLMSQAVGAQMVRQQSGVIINISSIYGMVGPDQRLYLEPGETEQQRFKPVDYSVTKSAVFGFTKYLASYWAGKGIRVNTLTLGGVYNQHEAGFTERYSSRAPIGRMAGISEYAGAVVFLFSPAASYMNGSNMIVDGGWTAW